MSSRASRPRPPASSISAARARPCSTGSTRAITAAGSCFGSRIPTRRARPRRRSTRSSTACAGSGSTGTSKPISSRNSPPGTPRSPQELLAGGHAYRCWMTPEELAAQREAGAARAPAVPHPQPVARPRRGRANEPFVVRLKAPQDGETVIEDRVQGRVAVQNEELDDFVLLRSDGSPTYMLAVVVDDHDMGVTHVIRGDDHLNNAFRQLAIIRAMGWPEPVYGHVPLIHGAGRGEALQAARGIGRRRLSRRARHPARGFVQLSAPARLGPWRRGDHQPRGRGQMVRSRPCRPLALALRFEEAREPQRPLSARSRSRAAGGPGRAEDRGRGRGAARPRDAGADGAGEGPERARRGRGLPVRHGARWRWTRRRRCC